MHGVSFVVPVRNGARLLEETLAAIAAQADRRPIEIIVVDDGSDDDSPMVLRQLAARFPLRLLGAGGRGAAAAINTGVRAAHFPIICQIDQDVVVRRDWLERVTADLEDPRVAATQGYFESDGTAGLCARAMNLDLEQRYAAIAGSNMEHVCTGNTAYRASALQAIGLFDESLGYGYDNDVSYRLLAAGYLLTIRRDARAVHRWREGLFGYLGQQYGFGYGRIDVVAKHPARLAGDSVSPIAMMLQPILTALAAAAAGAAALAAAAGTAWRPFAGVALALFGIVVLDRCVAGVAATRRFRSATPLIFPLLHVARNAAWVAAIIVWAARKAARRRSQPGHSMRSRRGYGRVGLNLPSSPQPPAILVAQRASASGPKRPAK